jgi:uncharacterized protein DUF4190
MSSTGPRRPRFEPPTYGSAGPSMPPSQPSSPPTPSYTPSQPYGYYSAPPVAPKTNALAIGSVICIVICPLILPGILGWIALSQIKNSRGTEKGEGLAITGIVIGAIGAFILLFAGLASLSG